MLGIFHGRGITDNARIFAQIDVDMRESLHVFNNGRNSNSLAVFLCIALHANEGGWAWPGRDLLRKETGISTEHALSAALAHLRRAKIDGRRIFTHFRVRDKETGAWGGSAYLIFPELEHPRPPFPNMEIWDPHGDQTPHVGNQQVGNPQAGDQQHEVEPSKVEPSKVEKESGGKKPPQSTEDADADWLRETRIEGESSIGEMSDQEKAAVASPSAQEPPPEPALPMWEEMMRKRLKGKRVLPHLGPDQIVAYCQRFYDHTSNPPPAHNKGNANWMSGAIATLESFHGSLYTLYESKGQPLPPVETQERVFNRCVDLFFTLGAGYDHISAPTPRSLSNSMPGLIADMVSIHEMYGLTNGTEPSGDQIDGWIAKRKEEKRAKRQGRGRATSPNAGAQRPEKTGEGLEKDRALAERLVARGG